jgi:hypothetical protein
MKFQNKNIRLAHSLLIFSSLFLSVQSFAGDAGGPNIVWANLAKKDALKIDKNITAIVRADNPMCWDASESHIYMKKRPAGLSNDLVREALVKNNSAAIKKISNILRNYRDEYTVGLDGIIAYVSDEPLRMIGLTTGDTKQDIDLIDPKNDLNALEASFCMVMPKTVRKP